MASRKRRVKKPAPKKSAKRAPVKGKSPKRKAQGSKQPRRSGRGARDRGSPRKTSPSPAKRKAAATRGAAKSAADTKRFATAAGKRYGKNSQTAKRLKELAAEARRWELEARKAKTVSGKERARAKATKARQAAANSFKAATREATHGQARQRGWREVAPVGPASSTNTFTSYEHARHGAGSVLSLMESRPGIVGVQSYRRVTQIENSRPSGLNAAGELRPQLGDRAREVGRELGFSRQEQEEFEAMLIEAELYGVELELEVENYSVEGGD
jgi:hypothetical protein